DISYGTWRESFFNKMFSCFLIHVVKLKLYIQIGDMNLNLVSYFDMENGILLYSFLTYNNENNGTSIFSQGEIILKSTDILLSRTFNVIFLITLITLGSITTLVIYDLLKIYTEKKNPTPAKEDNMKDTKSSARNRKKRLAEL
ncbi:MAG: hypothetical protein ACTSVC_14880, partial [Promethearchaeota archaeon]